MAEALSARWARSRFGVAITAMLKMIATAISNSLNEKTGCLCMLFSGLTPEEHRIDSDASGRQHSSMIKFLEGGVSDAARVVATGVAVPVLANARTTASSTEQNERTPVLL